MTELEKQYNKVKKLAQKHLDEGAKLDRLIMDRWGFKFSETDDDAIIDTLDYGIDNISFKTFERKMNGYKSNYEKNERYGYVE